MANNLICTFIIIIIIVTHSFVSSSSSAVGIKAGYWPSYLNSSFPASSINFTYFTHVYYAFVQPDSATFHLIMTQFDAENLPGFVAAAHAAYPQAKAMLTVSGGGNLFVFAGLVRDQSTRASFIASAIAVARMFDLDGLDLDWEFPKNGDEMNLLADLFVEWRAAVDKEAAASGHPKLLLSAAVYYASTVSRFV